MCRCVRDSSPPFPLTALGQSVGKPGPPTGKVAGRVAGKVPGKLFDRGPPVGSAGKASIAPAGKEPGKVLRDPRRRDRKLGADLCGDGPLARCRDGRRRGRCVRVTRRPTALGRCLVTPGQRATRARIAAHARWAASEDRRQGTAAARAAFLDRFERLVDPEQRLPAEERARRAENARKAHFARLVLLSSQARAARKR